MLTRVPHLRRAKAVILFLLLTVGNSQPSSAGYDEGVAAYTAGDYAAALGEWRPLAEAGDARAQNRLGVMYGKGQGVAKDDAAAVAWYRKAAEQGYAEAENNLGFRLDTGVGVRKNSQRRGFGTKGRQTKDWLPDNTTWGFPTETGKWFRQTTSWR